MRKGSITVFLSLTMLVILSLLGASLLSVRLAADRALCANAADQALFSLFSEYDRDLFGKYHLFFLDGGMDTGGPAFDAQIRFLKDSADYILNPGKGRILSSGNSPLRLGQESCELTGYTLATEMRGRIAAVQAVEYMKNTLGIQGVQLLLGTDSSSGSSSAAASQSSGEAILSDDLHAKMEGIRQESPPDASPPDGFVNPIETISEFQKLSLFSLVLPEGSAVSSKTYETGSFPSGRTLMPSLGTISLPGAVGGTDRLLFQGYLLTHCGSYLKPSEGTIGYEAEYLISGRSSDESNLKAVIRSLLLMRTGANAAAILADASLHAQASSAAFAIASAIAVPQFQPAVEALLIAGWSWCESILDLRALFAGKKVPPVKSGSDWQLRIENIPYLIGSGTAYTKDSSHGLSYAGYLRLLLLTKQQDTLQMRLLDVIETNVRSVCGRPSFRIDLCIDTAEARFTMRAENVLTLETIRKYSYREV